MFKKKTKENNDKEREVLKENSKIKYQKPKIMFIDLPNAAPSYVRSKGYNVTKGNFGSPYKVKIGNGYVPVIHEASLPNYGEQEIIFIDLTRPAILEHPEGDLTKGDDKFWAKCSFGIVDPCPAVMRSIQDSFDRILDYGGFFIIFAQPRDVQNVYWGKIKYGDLSLEENINIDNWSFLSILNPGNFSFNSDYGEETELIDEDLEIVRFLKKHKKEINFTTVIQPLFDMKKDWYPLVKNKYGKTIGGLIQPSDSKGKILILPQLSNIVKIKESFALLNNVIPEISPHLYPHFEGSKWIEREDYELESILKYKAEKIEIKRKTRIELENIDQKITDEREKLGFLHGVLTKSGTELVNHVESCLKYIGFNEVINVDKEIQEGKTEKKLQEDLQIKDESPILLLEVKGISGLPKEEDIIQVNKYVTRRMKEWDRTDIRGVSIINHQKNIPGLDRNNEHVFTKEQIEDAEHNDITIITTWDLFLLIKGILKYQWNPKNIRNLFYIKGRISRIPSNYTVVGQIYNYWEKINVVGINITDHKLTKGDRIAYVMPAGYLEENITSLQVDHKDVAEAMPGQEAGIKTKFEKEFLKKGILVYKVTEN